MPIVQLKQKEKVVISVCVPGDSKCAPHTTSVAASGSSWVGLEMEGLAEKR